MIFCNKSSLPYAWGITAALTLLLSLPVLRFTARAEAMSDAAGAQSSGGMGTPTAPAGGPAEAQQQVRRRVQAAHAMLPLSFEMNQGQTDPQVKFLSRAGSTTLWLTPGEAVLSVGSLSRSGTQHPSQTTLATLRMKFVGADARVVLEGEDRQPGAINYFSRDPSHWITGVPSYARVRYRRLYPGIDLVFHGNNRELEYDLVLAPGADPGRIRLAVAGAENLRIDARGNLVLETAAGNVVQQKPRIYQRIGATLKLVAGGYWMAGKNEVGFRLGNYDRRAAVVIDPVLRYSTLLGGGSEIDLGNAIAVDSSNRAVVAGFTCSQDFPMAHGITPSGSRFCSAFVTKFDFTGSRLIFSDVLGANATASGVALDADGNIYLTGITRSLDFPITPGAFQTRFAGGFSDGDAFVTKLNAGGTAILYSTFLGGDRDDEAVGIAVDSSRNAYVTGITLSRNFPTTAGAFQRECKLNNDACVATFVTKLNSTGSQELYSTFLNGNANLSVAFGGIAVDSAGHAFVTGVTAASDFPTTAGTAQPVFGGLEDAFVVKISSSGSHLVYSTFLGGMDVDQALDIALDAQGNAFVTGLTLSKNFPVRNSFQPACALVNGRCSNAFVTKLDVNGRVLYSTYLGRGGDIGTGIAVTPGGQAYVSGITPATNFPTTQTAFQRLRGGTLGGFLTKFDPAGKLIYSTYLGGNAGQSLPAVALDRDTNAYVTGQADSSFPVTPGAFQTTLKGASDAFVAKVVALCALNTANRTVTICTPGNGSTVQSPVNIVAGTTDVTPVRLTQIYLDGKKIYQAHLSAINVRLPIAGGGHRLTVQAQDTANVFFKKTIFVQVSH
jgi:hypothetical protein